MSSSSFLFTLTVVEIMKINLKNWDLNPWRTKESISTFDTLQTYKIIHGFDDVKSNTWFNTVGSDEHRLTRLTADPQNLIPSRSRRNWKLIKVVNLWNSLPGEIENAGNPKLFKKHLPTICWRTCFSKNIDVNSYSVNL